MSHREILDDDLHLYRLASSHAHHMAGLAGLDSEVLNNAFATWYGINRAEDPDAHEPDTIARAFEDWMAERLEKLAESEDLTEAHE